MKKILVCSLLLFFLASGARQALSEKTSSHAKLRLPWDVLQKILKLDDKTIQLDWHEFYTLLQSSNPQDLPDFSLSNGQVVLTRKEFNRLIKTLIPPAPASSKIYITKASYKGRLKDDHVLLTAHIRLHNQQDTGKPIRIDLFPAHLAFHEVLLDNKPALTETQGSRLYLTTDKTGDLNVTIRFSLKTPQAKSQQQISFPVIRTPVTEFEFEIPYRHMDIQVPQALHQKTIPSAHGTRVQAILPPTHSIQALWHPVTPQSDKEPAKIYSDTTHLLSIEDNAVRVKTLLRLQILKNTVNHVNLQIPKGFHVINVHGPGVGEWKEQPEKNRLLKIPFAYAQKGIIPVSLTTEKILTHVQSSFTFTGVPVQGAVREKGFLAVELKTAAEIPAPQQKGLERVDIQELPGALLSQSHRPLLYAYKFLRPLFALTLQVTPHQDITLLSSVIDSAQGTSLLLADGQRLHQMTYHVRHSAKQFLEIHLPPHTTLWNAFVDNKPVKPMTSTDAPHVLIPLTQGQNRVSAASAYPVDIVYYEKKSVPYLAGRASLSFPVPNMTVSRVFWTVHTPSHQKFFYGGTLFDKAKAPAAWTPTPSEQQSSLECDDVIAMGRMAGKRGASSVRQNRKRLAQKAARLKEIQCADMSARDEEESKSYTEYAAMPCSIPEPAVEMLKKEKQAVAGVLPVRIKFPLSGRKSYFSKTLPAKDSLMPLPLFYVSRGIIQAAQIIFGLFVLFLLFKMRAKIIAVCRKTWEKICLLPYSYVTHIPAFGWVSISALLCLLLAYGPPLLMLGAFLGFLVSVACWLVKLIRTKTEGKEHRA